MTLLIPRRGATAEQRAVASGLTLYQEIMADVPLGYWRNRAGQPHGGHVTDYSGNNLYLVVWQTVTDAASLITSNPSDLAWHLDAGENFWSETRWAMLDLTSDLSLSYWMRPTIFADGFDRDVVRKGNQYGTIINAAGKLIGFMSATVGGRHNMANGPVLTPGTVYHVGFTYEVATGTGRLYLNGVLAMAEVLQPPGTAVEVNSGTNFVCGAYSDAPHGYDGDLDEVAVFGHLLSPARMLAHYQAGVGAVSYFGEVMADSPVAYWPMTVAGTSMPNAVGGGPPLVLFAGAVGGVAGASAELGTAAEFDGVNDYGRVSAVDLSGTYIATVEYWLRWDTYDNNDSLSLEFGENNAIGGFAHDPDSSGGTALGGWAVFMGPSGFYEEQMARPPVGTWHHIVVVHKRDTALNTEQLAFYVDGVRSEGNLTGSTTIKSGQFANQSLNVMARSAVGDGAKNLFGKGAMQHLAIYPFELSAARIAAHYAAAT